MMNALIWGARALGYALFLGGCWTVFSVAISPVIGRFCGWAEAPDDTADDFYRDIWA